MNKQWWKGAVERSLRVSAASLIGLFSANQLVHEIDWPAGASVIVTAVLLDFAVSIGASSQFVPGKGPSLTTAEQTSAEVSDADYIYQEEDAA